MILTISVNRDSAGSDPWVTAVVPPGMLYDLRDRPAYSVVIMTLTDGVLDSQEFRVILSPEDGQVEWTLLSGRLATSDLHGGMVRGQSSCEDLAVLDAVQHAVRLVTVESIPGSPPGDGFA